MPSLEVEPGWHCALSSFCQHLRVSHIDIRESEVFFLAASQRFNCQETYLGWEIDCFDAIFAFAESVGSTVEAIDGSQISNPCVELQEYINQRKAVSINVAPQIAPHYRGSILSDMDAVHYIGIFAIDDDRAYISDACMPYLDQVRTFSGWVHYPRLLTAWEKTGYEMFIFPNDLWLKIETKWTDENIKKEALWRGIEIVTKSLSSLPLEEKEIVIGSNLKEEIFHQIFPSGTDILLAYILDIIKHHGFSGFYYAKLMELQKALKTNSWRLLRSLHRDDIEDAMDGLKKASILRKDLLLILNSTSLAFRICQ